ncbi:hypothetical protein M2120_001225 [Aurantimicrobium minutum]|nr:hypothetical protein [Aurantimicrobium minutum]
MQLNIHRHKAVLWKIGQILDFLGGGLYSRFRNVKGMKSQLMTALSIVGVLGTATTAMAVNTDALSNLDPSAIGNATDTLLPDPLATTDPAQVTDPNAPTATPAPVDPSATPAVPAVPGQAPAVPAVPSVEAAQVHGTSGGSGTRVATANGVAPAHHEEDHDDEGEHEEEDDD